MTLMQKTALTAAIATVALLIVGPKIGINLAQ